MVALHCDGECSDCKIVLLEKELDELRAWQKAVADGTGYINYAEGEAVTQRESAVRAAIEGLDMTQEAKDTLLDVWREVDGAYAAEVQRLRDLLSQTLQNCKYWSDDFKDEVRAALAGEEVK